MRLSKNARNLIRWMANRGDYISYHDLEKKSPKFKADSFISVYNAGFLDVLTRDGAESADEFIKSNDLDIKSYRVNQNAIAHIEEYRSVIRRSWISLAISSLSLLAAFASVLISALR